jgi:hypothetical protein
MFWEDVYKLNRWFVLPVKGGDEEDFKRFAEQELN